ncbi:MAG TPA: VIT1/CCC1 transporter family protein [Candidatus Limnocylindria bacterium]
MISPAETVTAGADREAALRELKMLQREHSVDTTGRLRAAVLGANDGLVSNVSLVMGMAGAAPAPGVVLLAGLAGVVAGALSMALGEYVSVRVQRESFESLIAVEKREIALHPEHEQHEITVIYRAKGIPRPDAERIAAHVMQDPEVALDLMAREELGLNPDELGSPIAVAFSSMAAFGSGAIVPVLPFLFLPVATAAPVAALLTVVALLLTGGYTARMIGRPPLRGALRLALLGGAAALITFVAGRIAGAIAASA